MENKFSLDWEEKENGELFATGDWPFLIKYWIQEDSTILILDELNEGQYKLSALNLFKTFPTVKYAKNLCDKDYEDKVKNFINKMKYWFFKE